MTKEQAVQSAGAKLDQLNTTMTRVLYAAIAATVLLLMIAGITAYAAWEYTRIKSAVGQAQQSLRQSSPKPPVVGKVL